MDSTQGEDKRTTEELKIIVLVNQLFATSATDEQLKLRLVKNIRSLLEADRHQTIEQCIAAGPKDWNRDNDGYETGFNSSNAAWRTALTKMKEGSGE